ncbi:hypothetical protein BKA69DRAFT_720340 [Paraphysoderma sedebokerense]|nr:hypothetical protein BKA69DRAFT_720340 [Paraphysoderma sedebokerense]
MFSSLQRLQERQGKTGTPRIEYLNQLLRQLQSASTSIESKLQVIANLANFAYDPINYDYFKQLNIVDLFLDVLDDPPSKDNPAFAEFALGGLCNLINDPRFSTYILSIDNIALISQQLSSSNEETVCSALTILYYLSCEQKSCTGPEGERKNEVVDKAILNNEMKRFLINLKKAKSNRLKNLATVFIEDCFGEK